MFTYFALLPLLFTGSFGSPTPVTSLSPRFVESSPWELHDLRIFTAAVGTPGLSYISFTFTDTNIGLNLSTACTRYVMPTSLGGGGMVADSTFYTCANSTVGWSYDGKGFSLSRRYLDPSLGSPPYDHATAFGDATTNFTSSSKSACGTLTMQDVLKVPITKLIAKE